MFFDEECIFLISFLCGKKFVYLISCVEKDTVLLYCINYSILDFKHESFFLQIVPLYYDAVK